jgi:hypothetical protein
MEKLPVSLDKSPWMVAKIEVVEFAKKEVRTCMVTPLGSKDPVILN